jgi:hypothetical protein
MWTELTPIPIINSWPFFSLIDFAGPLAGAMDGALEANQNCTLATRRICGRTAKVFERGEPYSVVAAIFSESISDWRSVERQRELSSSIGIAAGFMIRMCALRFQWKTKAARQFSDCRKDHCVRQGSTSFAG